MKKLVFCLWGLVFFHFLAGIIGLDFGTFELIALFNNSKALDIWWAPWFDTAYVWIHVGLLLFLTALMAYLPTQRSLNKDD